jgi:23S rRNA (guanosine2251-2'-O)-methyltransferase
MLKESECIFGLRPVIEAIKAGKQIDRLLIKQGLQGALYHELMVEVRNNNIVYQIVPLERIELVTRKNHQGVLAWLSCIECLGVHAVIIPEKGSARITGDAIKTSAGALHTLPVCREKSVIRSVELLKNSGLKVICAAEKAGRLAFEVDLTDPLVLILGSEDKGISRELLALADDIVRVPMYGNIGSFNVSVAAGILTYEIVRQRSK